MSDAKLVVEGLSFKVHRAVLADGRDVFKVHRAVLADGRRLCIMVNTSARVECEVQVNRMNRARAHGLQIIIRSQLRHHIH